VVIRVFPRKTKWTPTDDLAFYDDPPMFELPDLPVRVSVAFTWDIEKGKQLASAWAGRSRKVLLGGPAFDDPADMDFVPGRFIKHGVTFTSRGCPKHCPWCLVAKREGKIRELPIIPGYIVQDNNLLACSRGHIERVFEMLAAQKKGIEFKGGLDIDYMQPWHIELLKKIKVAELWVACDRKEDLKRLNKAAELLSDFNINKRRCYVLLGFRGENIANAEKRCEAVYAKGFLPFAQLYKDNLQYHKPKFVWSKEWRDLQRKWSRPAIYRSRMLQGHQL